VLRALRALLLALQFLTVLPLPVRWQPQPQDWGRSVFFFPWVGFIVGLLLCAVYAALWRIASAEVLAILLLTFWVLLTGALHLDGLADVADAWLGGLGDRERTLQLMKDPHSGAIAIVVVVLTLLLKYAALTALVANQAWPALLLSPLLGRSAMVVLLLTTPYVRPAGIGAAHAQFMPRRACVLMLCIIALGLALLPGLAGVYLLLGTGLVLLGWRRLLLARLGGITGDTLGALCEWVEALVLLGLSMMRIL